MKWNRFKCFWVHVMTSYLCQAQCTQRLRSCTCAGDRAERQIGSKPYQPDATCSRKLKMRVIRMLCISMPCHSKATAAAESLVDAVEATARKSQDWSRLRFEQTDRPINRVRTQGMCMWLISVSRYTCLPSFVQYVPVPQTAVVIIGVLTNEKT